MRTMIGPATLLRTSPETADDGASRTDTVVAQGSFLIMAYAYLAQPPAERRLLWIRTEHDDVLPEGIEAIMNGWLGRAT